MRKISIASILACAALGCGCAGPHADFVSSERANYDAISPDHLKLTDQDKSNDPVFTPEQSDRRARTLQTWDASIKAQEAAAVAGGAK